MSARRRFAMVSIVALGSIGLTAGGLAARQGATPRAVVAHEWGTFTSVADVDGEPVEWAPFTGPQDLPCHVTELNPFSVKDQAGLFVNFVGTPGGSQFLPGLRATVRMETPVIYFYSPADATVSVHVDFPKGLITEWYPQAQVPWVAPDVQLSSAAGSIDWPTVKIRPGAEEAFPSDQIASHYYAARQTDAAPVEVGDQVEKFLFYRGLADFPVQLSVRLDAAGRVTIDRGAAPALPNAILFESDGRRIGYRVLGPVNDTLTAARPALTLDSSSSALSVDLEGMLAAAGLTAREASAMVATWRDSWFEPGLRLFYMMPRASVDRVLPLSIRPAPAEIVRAFVGRVEVITPEMEAAVASALRAGDVPALAAYGRFLDPIANRLLQRMSTVAEQSKAQAVLRAVGTRFASAAAVTARACQ